MAQETKSKSQEARERQEQLNDIIAVMDMAAGRRLVWRILAEARVFGTVYAGQSNQTFFREGKRNLGLWLMEEVLQAKPEQYLLMQKEHYILEEDSND